MYSSSFSQLSLLFFLIFNRMNKCFSWVILSNLAHLAHLAQSYFSLTFSAINTYNCDWFNLTNKKNYNDWRQKLEKCLQLLAAITGISISRFSFSPLLMFVSKYNHFFQKLLIFSSNSAPFIWIAFLRCILIWTQLELMVNSMRLVSKGR